MDEIFLESSLMLIPQNSLMFFQVGQIVQDSEQVEVQWQQIWDCQVKLEVSHEMVDNVADERNQFIIRQG